MENKKIPIWRQIKQGSQTEPFELLRMNVTESEMKPGDIKIDNQPTILFAYNNSEMRAAKDRMGEENA